MDSEEWTVGNDILMALDSNNYSSSDLSPHSTDSDLHLSANPPFDPTQPFEEPPLLQSDLPIPHQSTPGLISIKQEPISFESSPINEQIIPDNSNSTTTNSMSASENVKSNPR